MVDQYNARASNQGLSPSEMIAYQGNLLSSTSDPELEKEDLYEFDIAVVGLGFHHFDNPALAARKLGERLKKGGIFGRGGFLKVMMGMVILMVMAMAIVMRMDTMSQS
ncbi:hypothetical protein DID88_005564 [Monilinia fructigena]|uniref:Methyltransferase type 11 domain-containing protein n=1 Tax=Monilinia fructigena TaxID=38457 RepID=A0A395J074_9HELO|nr:hypothetical protein DID88_005564 [Monilinia fructigena]